MSQFGFPMAPPSQAPYAQYALTPKTDGAAITALVLAIASFMFWIMPAVMALAIAPGAKRRINASNGASKGLGIALAAQIVAAVALGMEVLAIALIGLV